MTTTPYGMRALADELHQLAHVSEGGRNDQLNRSAFKLFQRMVPRHLDAEHVIKEFREVCRPWIGQPGHDPFTWGEFERTITSARNGGAANPRTVEPRRAAPGHGGFLQPGAADQQPSETGAAGGGRRIRLTQASSIKPRPVRWLWRDRIPVGEITVTPGRGGIGKSTFHAWLIAQITTGRLDGVHSPNPRPCIIAATEDSWQYTIIPRLIAAGADLNLVARVDVVTETGAEAALTLPADLSMLHAEITRTGVVLVSVDPLMSTINASLDTDRDRPVREVLDPLAVMAHDSGVVVLGNCHFNKSRGNDPLTLIMGSAAFGNVPRAALGFARDDDDQQPDSCVISQVKNNLGRLDLPNLRYRIEGTAIDTEEGPAQVGRLAMLGETATSVQDILSGGNNERTERDDARDFLRELLASGPVPAKQVKAEAGEAGHTWMTVRRAAEELKVNKAKIGKPGEEGGWVWAIPRHEE